MSLRRLFPLLSFALVACGGKTELDLGRRPPPLSSAGPVNSASPPVSCPPGEVACNGKCTVGLCAVSATSDATLRGGCSLAVSAAGVYWIDSANATAGSRSNVLRTPREGGPTVTLASNQAIPGDRCSIAVDATGAYWPVIYQDPVTHVEYSAIVRAEAGGGALVTVAAQQDDTYAVAAGPGALYWTNAAIAAHGPPHTATAVVKRSEGGGGPTTLVSSATSTSWPLNMIPRGLAAASGVVAFISLNSGVIAGMGESGGEPRMLASGQNAGGIAVDRDYVYWTDEQQRIVLGNVIPLGTVKRIGHDGGVAATLAPDQEYVGPLVVSEANVYWIAWSADAGIGGGTIVKAPLDGGPITTIASDQPGPSAIALDGTSIYWANAYGGRSESGVMSAPR